LPERQPGFILIKVKKALVIFCLLVTGASAQNLVTLGEEFMRLENWPVAVNYFDQALAQDPKLAKAWFGKGLSLCQIGKPNEGISALDRALELSPKNVQYLYVTGVCHEWRGKEGFSQAEAYYKKALQLAPGEVQVRHRLASLYQQDNRCQDAIPEFKKVIATAPDYFASYNNLANCWLSLNRPEPAVKLYQEAIQLAEYPGEYHFYHHLGIALVAAHRVEESKAAFLIETALNPDFPDAHLNLGNIYLLEKNFERALEEYRDVLSIDPDSPEGNINLGELYLLIKQPEVALQFFEHYAELKPDSGKGHYFLSLCYEKLGEKDKAWEEMDKSLKLGYHPEPLKSQMRQGQQ